MRHPISVTARHVAFLGGPHMILTGQVLLIHSRRGFWGRVVQAVSGSYWNHNVVVIPGGRCVSAEPGGAVIRPVSYYARDHVVVASRFELTQTERYRIADWAIRHVGVQYSYGDFIAAGLASITRRATPDWLRRIVSRPDRLICSQLCDLALQAGNVHLFRDSRPLGAVTPADFGRVYVSLGFTDKA